MRKTDKLTLLLISFLLAKAYANGSKLAKALANDGQAIYNSVTQGSRNVRRTSRMARPTCRVSRLDSRPVEPSTA